MDHHTPHAPVSRRALLGAGLGAGGLFLAGCGGGSSSGASGNGTVLRVGIPTDVLLSAVQRFNPSNRPLRRTVFDVLVDRSQDGTYTPSLASSYEWSSDKRKLVLKLTEGATFHSGRDFGPDDVIFTIQTAMKKESGVQQATLLRRANGIKKTGSAEVTVTFDQPFLSYLDALAMVPVIDKETYPDLASGKKVVGTGPFVWKSWTPESSLTMERNDSYWQEGKPHLAGLEFSVIKESQALLAAMRSDDLDLANRMLARDAATLKEDDAFAVSATPGFDTYVGVTTTVKPLDDVRVRQAVAYCIDRKRIAEQVYKGFAQPTCALWDPKTPGVTDAMINHYTYDIEKAKSLLAEAGASGAEIEFAPSPQDPSLGALGDIVQYGLEQAGIKVKRVSITAADWPKRNQSYDLPALWVSIIGFTVSGPVPTLLGSNPLTTDANTSHFTTSTYKSLTNKLLAASSEDDKSTALGQLTDYMIDQAFHLSVAQTQVPIVATAGLSDVTVDSTLSLTLTDAKMAS